MVPIKKMIEDLIPKSNQLFFRFYWNYFNGNLDKEMFYVNKLIKSRRRFIDVGANVGLYSYFFSNKFDHVEAFEPLSELTFRLKFLSNNNIHVNNVALSSSIGQLEFFIPIHNNILQPPLASLEPRLGHFEKRVVDVINLDNYEFDDVDLIKIDVEGHEYKVIEGALKTISSCNPVLIIEIEQRHLAIKISEVFEYVEKLEYDGYFLFEGVLKPLKEFSYSLHQEQYLSNVYDKRYVNNFIFLPKNF
jgi:FkbM family methyltransferase